MERELNKSTIKPAQENSDPITGERGAHPLGTGLGAAAGGMAVGAAVGTAAGPIGTAIGAAVGAIAGGLGGKAVAEHFDPTIEDQYWRDNFGNESYYESGMTYDDYQPAYRLGYESRNRYNDQSFDDVETTLAADYERDKGDSRLTWDSAKHATRSAWNRVVTPRT